MSELSAVAGQLRSLVERIEHVETDIAALNTDKSEIYKEARAIGFDVKVIRKVVAKRKLDEADREEQDAVFDLYWSALHGAPAHVHDVQARTREKIEEIPAPAFPAAADGQPSIPSPDADRAKSETGPAALAGQVAEANIETVKSGQAVTLSQPRTLRPHCRNPTNCGGYGKVHCGSCLRLHEKDAA